MSTIKVKKRHNPFAQIDKGILKDKNLSFKARGIAAYLFCMKDGSEVRLNDLVKNSANGIKSIRSGMQELKNEGYARLIPLFDENKQLMGKTWEVSEEKNTDIPISATSPKSERREMGTTNNNGISIDIPKKSECYSFEQFWNDYNLKKGKAKCQKKWAKLSAKVKQKIQATLPAYIADTCISESGPKNWKPRRKYPATYLNQKVWEDYESAANEKTDTSCLTEEQKQGYKLYLDWAEKTHPDIIPPVKYFSAGQYKQYKELKAHMSDSLKFNFLKIAHRRWETETEKEVFDIFIQKIDEYKKEMA